MKKIIKILLITFLFVAISIGAILGIQGYSLYKETIENTPIAKKIEELKSDKNYVKIENLPKDYLNAVVATEDRRFYDHGAVDVVSIGRAIYVNIRDKELKEGGSTITQQLAKNMYYITKQDTIRKVAEVFTAFDLEKEYSKDEILELYVNISYFGDGYYGIGEAAKGYLDKAPKDMTLAESSLMAGIPNAPSVYAPTQNPDLAKKRQKHVIRCMVENGYISEEDAKRMI